VFATLAAQVAQAAPPTAGVAVVEQSAFAVVRDSIMGGLTIIAIAMAVLAILRTQRVYQDWLKDKDAQAASREKADALDRDAQGKTAEAIRNQTDAIKEMTSASREVSTRMAKVEANQEGVANTVRWIYGQSSGQTRAVGSPPSRRDPRRD
jgi:hypothetical protein